MSVLPRIYSDHRPLLLRLENQTPHNGNRPFRFEAMWFTHDKFSEFVENNWDIRIDWNSNMAMFTKKIKDWNIHTFGNIGRKKRKIISRLSGIQRDPNYSTNRFLHKLERELHVQLDLVLSQEEILWQQKSRCQWLVQGDRNTKYFHIKAIARRRRNRVTML